MKKTFLLFFLALVARAYAAQSDLPPLYTVIVDSHRCLVLEPDHLPQNAPLVVLLQGAHGSATSLIYLWSELHLPPGRVVCPDGRLFLEGKGFGWYHKENQSDIVQSRDYLLKLVQRLGPKRPVIFAGFSQGGVMSIVTGLHCPNKVLAIVSMSGYVPNPAENLRDLKAPRSVPILMVHGGQMDETIPIADARFGETSLNAQGYHPVFKTLSMGHRISQESLNSVRDFLAQVLPKN